MKSNNNVDVLIFKVLSNGVRVAIISALLKTPMSVNRICEEVKETQPRVSHELRCLLACGFVSHERKGKKIIYFLNGNTAIPIIKAVNAHAKLFGDRIIRCKGLSDIMK